MAWPCLRAAVRLPQEAPAWLGGLRTEGWRGVCLDSLWSNFSTHWHISAPQGLKKTQHGCGVPHPLKTAKCFWG